MGLRHREKDDGAGPYLVRGEVPGKAGRPGCTGCVVLGTESGFYAKSNNVFFSPTYFENITDSQEVVKIV